jgi:hypothetical protein
VTSDQITARRRARDLVQELRWNGVAVSPLYQRMAGEFRRLVQSGEYGEWVATGGGGRRGR